MPAELLTRPVLLQAVSVASFHAHGHRQGMCPCRFRFQYMLLSYPSRLRVLASSTTASTTAVLDSEK